MAGIIIGIVIALAAITLAAFEWHKFSPRRTLRRISSLQPLLIRIPTIRKTGMPTEGVQEFGLAAEFFSILSGTKTPFAVEIAVPHVGAKASCFVVVPTGAVPFVQKTLHDFWPDAEVLPVSPHTIFNPTGTIAATVLLKKTAQKHEFQTYATLKTNSCLPVIRAFNDIHAVGEGLALQILVKSAPAHALHLTSKLLEQEERTKARFGRKGKRRFFSVNIRLVASAPSPFRADELLDRLSRAFNHFAAPEGQAFRVTKAKQPQKTVQQFLARAFDDEETISMSGDELVSIIHLPTCGMGI